MSYEVFKVVISYVQFIMYYGHAIKDLLILIDNGITFY